MKFFYLRKDNDIYTIDGKEVKVTEGNYDRYFNTFEALPAIKVETEAGITYRPVPWVHLHVHTESSLLDGAIKISELADTLDKGGADYSPVSAITDHGNVFGAVEFSDTFTVKHKEAGLKPIIGCEVYAQSVNNERKNCHLILLCKNEIGKTNLFHLLSEAENNMYRHANITFELLEKYHEGLICMTACLGGEFNRYLVESKFNAAREMIECYKDLFGEDFYIEIQNHGIEDELLIRNWQLKIAEEYGVKIVATADSHYLRKNDAEAHDVLLCIGTKAKLTDVKRMRMEGTGYHYLTNSEAYDLFSDTPEAIQTQWEIAEKCDFVFEDKQVVTPAFPVPAETTEWDYFENMAREGLKKRFPEGIDKEHADRLEYELSVIKTMGFAGYFLIVQEFISWAENQGIGIGPGRGSAVGSIIAYAIGITDLDPIPYGLLFERFLNPERVTMPDIDVDIADDRRDEVLDHTRELYGSDHVSRIITFGTLAAKAVIRCVGRVYDIDAAKIDKLAKSVPKEIHMTLQKAYDESPETKDLVDSDSELKKVFSIALRLEGLKRNPSQHACGVIISPTPVSDTVPEKIMLDKNKNPARTACFIMSELEARGLLKMDFLGLRNMSVIKKMRDSLNLEKTDLDLFDPAVYADIATGNTDSVFQIESPGMKNLMKQIFADAITKDKLLKNTDERKAYGKECFERMIAAIAIYRPGPMDSIPAYVEGMRNPSGIQYDTPELEPILSTTYGVILYQEQVQQICRELAGYSLGRADIIRRAMAKKKKYIMDAEKEIFLHGNKAAYDAGKEKAYVPGCISNGISEAAALTIWSKMESFASYAFNKSHAAGYAVITVQTAFLKKYYPVQFWAETLNSVIAKRDNLKKYISAARKSGINILPPDVVASSENFKTENGCVRMGLRALKSCGKGTDEMVQERNDNGPYSSFEEFLERACPKKQILQALAYTGAFESFGYNRATVVYQIDEISEYRKLLKKVSSPFDFKELDELFAKVCPLELRQMPELKPEAIFNKEYEYSGMFISGNPLDPYKNIVDAVDSFDLSALTVERNEEGEIDENAYEALEEYDGTVCSAIGVATEVEKRLTKTGKPMVMGVIEASDGSSVHFVKFDIEPTFVLNTNAPIIITGKIQVNDRGVSLMAREITHLKDYKIPNNRVFCVLLNTDTALEDADNIASSTAVSKNENGCVFCARIIDKKGNKHTYAYSLSEHRLVRVGKNANRPLTSRDNLKLNVDFKTLSEIREKVRDVKVIEIPKMHSFYDPKLPGKIA